jgi:hypothetical protein
MAIIADAAGAFAGGGLLMVFGLVGIACVVGGVVGLARLIDRNGWF